MWRVDPRLGPGPRRSAAKQGVEARVAAADVVRRVSDEGAYSNVLTGRLGTRHPPAVAGHARRLAMDALRLQRSVDAAIEKASDRPLDSLDPVVRAVLRVGGAELASEAAPHAAVDSAVEATRHLGAGKAAKFVNAVMRRLADRPPDRSIEAATPPWVRSRLSAAWGPDAADAFLEASAEAARPGVRLRDPGLAHEPAGIPGAGYVDGAELAGLAASGAVVVADPASTAVGLAVEARPGQAVLDAAAAPGGKTSHLWDQMEGTGLLVAADRHGRRLRSAARRLDALGMQPCWVVADMAGPPFREASFDRVLLDAPCTGLGTIRRRPEILHHLDPDDPSRLARLQRRLLEASLRLLAPGGRLVYSVCTVFPEETIDVVAGFEARPPEGLPGQVWGDGLLLAPHLTGTDGMFIAVIDRAAAPEG